MGLNCFDWLRVMKPLADIDRARVRRLPPSPGAPPQTRSAVLASLCAGMLVGCVVDSVEPDPDPDVIEAPSEAQLLAEARRLPATERIAVDLAERGCALDESSWSAASVHGYSEPDPGFVITITPSCGNGRDLRTSMRVYFDGAGQPLTSIATFVTGALTPLDSALVVLVSDGETVLALSQAEYIAALEAVLAQWAPADNAAAVADSEIGASAAALCSGDLSRVLLREESASRAGCSSDRWVDCADCRDAAQTTFNALSTDFEQAIDQALAEAQLPAELDVATAPRCLQFFNAKILCGAGKILYTLPVRERMVTVAESFLAQRQEWLDWQAGYVFDASTVWQQWNCSFGMTDAACAGPPSIPDDDLDYDCGAAGCSCSLESDGGAGHRLVRICS